MAIGIEVRFARVSKDGTSLSPSSLRTQGPIRRVACCDRRCSGIFARRRLPVVIGPCVRRDDASAI
jgi:hypothetical protein